MFILHLQKASVFFGVLSLLTLTLTAQAEEGSRDAAPVALHSMEAATMAIIEREAFLQELKKAVESLYEISNRLNEMGVEPGDLEGLLGTSSTVREIGLLLDSSGSRHHADQVPVPSQKIISEPPEPEVAEPISPPKPARAAVIKPAFAETATGDHAGKAILYVDNKHHILFVGETKTIGGVRYELLSVAKQRDQSWLITLQDHSHHNKIKLPWS